MRPRAAAQPGERVVSPGGEREEEGAGLEQSAHTRSVTAAERAAGSARAHTHSPLGWFYLKSDPPSVVSPSGDRDALS